MSERFQELATAGEGSVKVRSTWHEWLWWQVWALPSFEQVHEFRSEEQPQALTFHPEKHLLVVSFQSSLGIFDVETQAFGLRI